MTKQDLQTAILEAIEDKSISESRRQHLFAHHRVLWDELQQWRTAHGLDRLPTPYLPSPFQTAAVARAMGKVTPLAVTGRQSR